MTIKSFGANKDIAGKKFIKLAADYLAENAAASSDNIIGVSGLGVSKDEAVDCYLTGEVCEITAGGAYLAGDPLTSDDSGNAVKAATGDNIGAISLEAATEKGDITLIVVNIQRTITE